jgi:serine phosphatase RsbU (regulator of sigma subunit)
LSLAVLALFGFAACEQFGRGRLKQSLLRHASGDASVILDGVMRDVFDFRGTAPQRDDLTLVVLKRTP